MIVRVEVFLVADKYALQKEAEMSKPLWCPVRGCTAMPVQSHTNLRSTTQWTPVRLRGLSLMSQNPKPEFSDTLLVVDSARICKLPVLRKSTKEYIIDVSDVPASMKEAAHILEKQQHMGYGLRLQSGKY